MHIESIQNLYTYIIPILVLINKLKRLSVISKEFTQIELLRYLQKQLRLKKNKHLRRFRSNIYIHIAYIYIHIYIFVPLKTKGIP